MKVLKKRATGEITEKKSRFIANICPVFNEDEALSFIKEMKKKYYDARHNCFSYIISGESLSSSSDIIKSSDDGEPGGTAGRPMTELLLNEEIKDISAVVTRYFGGVLLGTGGLIRAYQGALKEALNNAEILIKNTGDTAKLTIPYDIMGKIEYYLAEHDDIIKTDASYGEAVLFSLIIPDDKKEMFFNDIRELSFGKAKVELLNHVSFFKDSDSSIRIL